MNLAELERRVARHLKLDLRPLYSAYLAKGGGDIEGFLAFLGAERAIDPAVLKDLHALSDVEVPAISDPVYRDTLLGPWAEAATQPGLPSPPGGAGAPSALGGHDLPANADRFQTISRLGEGAMGAIDIARDVYLRRKVALKTVLPEMARHPEIMGRFLSEMQITAQLEHPNIVPVYALDVRQGGALGYAMKLVQGRDLATLLDEARAKIDKGEPLGDEHSLDKRLEIFLKVCDALEYAHEKGIVHRDLKPANIMIGRHNEVYLMDWGIARPIGEGGHRLDAGFGTLEENDPAARAVGRTRVGETIGTPQYMSPEQAMGKNPELDGRSDLYAMGLILQECVTLRTAVDGKTLQEVLTKALLAKRDPVPVGNRPGAVPREIDAVVAKATRPDPKDRYPSVRALADDVRRYLRNEAVSVLPEGPLHRAGRWLGKHRMATVTLLLGLGLVGAAGTIGALVSGQARIEAEHARELRASRMATASAIQTQLVDRDLTRYEASLEELAGAVQIVLSKLPPSEVAPYFDESFAKREGAPPDLGPSPRYHRDVSVLAPVTSLAPGVSRDAEEPLLRSLGLVGPAMRACLLRSSGLAFRALSGAEQRALIADAGVPAYRASIVLREGITVSFPGMARSPADPREAPDLNGAEAQRGVVWGTPTAVDGEPILPATAPLHDERGAFRGIARLEIALNKLLDRPPADDLGDAISRSLVRRDGTVMAEDGKHGAKVPLAPEVARAIADGKSGTLVAEVNGHRYRYGFYPLSSLDWYYVSAGEEDPAPERKEPVGTSEPPRRDAPAKGTSPKPVAPPPP
ncbi:MAG: serine/threonine protein kinase [Byssovorax sp.]